MFFNFDCLLWKEKSPWFIVVEVRIQFMGFTGLFYGLIMHNFEFLAEF